MKKLCLGVLLCALLLCSCQGNTDQGTQDAASYGETIAKAQDLGILYGYEDNTIRPKNTLSRAEGVALLMNLVECLEAA